VGTEVCNCIAVTYHVSEKNHMLSTTTKGGERNIQQRREKNKNHKNREKKKPADENLQKARQLSI